MESVQAELRRTAQRIGEREILAPVISIRVPEDIFARWAPVLPQLVAELGTEPGRWAERRGAMWYGNRAPSVTVELEKVQRVEITVEFPAPRDRHA